MRPLQPGRRKCPVPDCEGTLPERFLLCKKHWDVCPSPDRKRVVDAFNAGAAARETGTWPTREYAMAAKAAVDAILRQRQRPETT